MRNKKLVAILTTAFLSTALIAFSAQTKADPLSFPAVWNEINVSSPAQEASRLQVESLTESQTRASHHWLPKI